MEFNATVYSSMAITVDCSMERFLTATVQCCVSVEQLQLYQNIHHIHMTHTQTTDLENQRSEMRCSYKRTSSDAAKPTLTDPV